MAKRNVKLNDEVYHSVKRDIIDGKYPGGSFITEADLCEQFGVWGEKSFMGKTYDGIHRISFLIDADGKIEHVFDDFKTSNHHDVVLNWLKEHA